MIAKVGVVADVSCSVVEESTISGLPSSEPLTSMYGAKLTERPVECERARAGP